MTAGVVLPLDVVKGLKALKINTGKKLLLYRGLGFDSIEEAKSRLNVEEPPILGSKIKIVQSRPSSWTTNICLATGFSMSNVGIVISTMIKPEDIVIDTRMLENRADYYPDDQAEIIVDRGRYNAKVVLVTADTHFGGDAWRKKL